MLLMYLNILCALDLNQASERAANMELDRAYYQDILKI